MGLVPQVKKILTMAGVLTVMNEYKSEESALRDIHEGGLHNGKLCTLDNVKQE